MTPEEFYLYQEQLFDSFCKTVIRHESASIFAKLKAQAEAETSFSALSFADTAQLSTEDTYQLEDAVTFHVHGIPVTIHDTVLGQALFALPPKRRDVILMFYFLDKSEPQIGKVLRLTPGAVNYRRATSLRRLKEILEGLGYET